MKTIYHSRKSFYNGLPIYWYEFKWSNGDNLMLEQLCHRFLRVPETIYYEYGGTHEEALKELTAIRLFDIIEGEEI